jgi:hypothetical protein
MKQKVWRTDKFDMPYICLYHVESFRVFWANVPVSCLRSWKLKLQQQPLLENAESEAGKGCRIAGHQPVRGNAIQASNTQQCIDIIMISLISLHVYTN